MLLQTRRIVFGDFVLDPAARQLKRGDETVPVTGKAFDLLMYMATNSGRPLLKKELLDAVWPDSFVEEANLTQNVFVLRKAMGPTGSQIIQTLPGQGYQFTALATELPEITAPPAVQSGSLPAAQPVLPSAMVQTTETTETRLIYQEDTEEIIPFWRSPIALTVAFAAIVFFGLSAWLGWQRYEDRVGGPPLQVVLADLDGTTGDTALDRTLLDAVRIDLNQSPFVSVVSANTVRRTMTEMLHKPDEPLTAALARDLCERTGSQAVLHGSVARLGSKFLLTEDATSCVDGSALGSAKREAESRDDLAATVDHLTATLRHVLGESRRTVAHFSTPLFPEKTGSIDALKDYSEALALAQRGRMPEAIALEKQAVTLDPNFAAGWLELAVISGNAGDYQGQRDDIQKAYALRSLANEPTRLGIIAMYNEAYTGDLYESRTNFKTWAQLYPRAYVPWSGLLQANRELGLHAEAVEAGKHALALSTKSITPYYGLALEQLHAGDPQGSRATCELALSRGFDGDVIRGVLLRDAVVMDDANLRAEQVAWSGAHPEATYVLSSLASLAEAEGRFNDARALFDRTAEAYRRQGLNDAADSTWRGSTASWVALGDMEDARAALQHGTVDTDEPFDLLALESVGQGAKADVLMKAQLAKHPQSTLTNRIFAPWLRAEIALHAHNPQEALAEFSRIPPFDNVFLEVRSDRANALLDAGRLPEAEDAFRDVIAHAYINSLSESIPLAWLNLGRALARENKTANAIEAYKHFFGIWSHTNGNPALLEEARSEAAKLGVAKGS